MEFDGKRKAYQSVYEENYQTKVRVIDNLKGTLSILTQKVKNTTAITNKRKERKRPYRESKTAERCVRESDIGKI